MSNTSAGTIELPLIKKGCRVLIFKTRNLFIIVSILSLLLFLATVPFINSNVAIELLCRFLIVTFVFTMALTLLLSIILLIINIVGVLIINDERIYLKLRGKEINLESLLIILNADEIEFTKKHKISKLLTTGNYIYSHSLSSEQAPLELIISKENRIKLLDLSNEKLQFKPMFRLRPILMEPPLQLFNVFISWLRGWI